jgi:Sulfotransferase family
MKAFAKKLHSHFASLMWRSLLLLLLLLLLLPAAQVLNVNVHEREYEREHEREHEHEHRVHVVNEYCAPLAPLIGWSQRAFVLAKHQLVACSPPKSACQLVKRLLRYVNGADDWQRGEVHDPNENGLKRLCVDVVGDNAWHVLRNPLWHRFIVVRDPLDRFISAYVDKAINFPYIRRYTFFRRVDAAAVVSVDMVVDWLNHFKSPRDASIDEHFALQSTCCNARSPHVKFHVIRQRALNEELPRYLRAHTSMDAALVDRVEHVLTTRHEHPTNHTRVIDYLNVRPALLARIVDFYAEDYELFQLERPTIEALVKSKL